MHANPLLQARRAGQGFVNHVARGREGGAGSSAADPNPLAPMRYALALDPGIETTVWLIVAALGCALVLILSEMVQNRK